MIELPDLSLIIDYKNFSKKGTKLSSNNNGETMR